MPLDWTSEPWAGALVVGVVLAQIVAFSLGYLVGRR